MVYTGKPSRGCQTCKSRRIRCDEARPACGNCKKSGRTCPGFPDEFDLIFRNENAAVARRTKRAASKQKPSPSASSSSKPSGQSPPRLQGSVEAVNEAVTRVAETVRSAIVESPQESPNAEQTALALVQQNETTVENATRIAPPDRSLMQAFLRMRGFAMPHILQPSLETQATAFFFRNFVLPPQRTESARGFLDLLVPYYNTASTSSALHLATHAVALSVLGNYPGRTEAMRDAQQCYGRALRKTQEALSDPHEAKSDQTLLTIMLFVLYEVFQNHKRRLMQVASTTYIEDFKTCAIHATNGNITAWAHHIDGAVALTKLRGPEQLEQESSRKLFQATRSLMLTNAMQKCTPVEQFPGFPGWEVGDENDANRLTVISMDLPALRSRVRALMSEPYKGDRVAEAWSLIGAAKAVDSALQQWSLNLSDHWAYKTVAYQTEMPADVRSAERWVGSVHSYSDIWTSHIWNDYRITRVFTLCVVMACCEVIDPDNSNLEVKAILSNARFVTQALIDDLCASVPFHLSADLQDHRWIDKDQDREEALGGFLLVWHIFVAANVECIPEPQREWLQGRLLHIGQEFGISRAQMLGVEELHARVHGDTPNMRNQPFFSNMFASTEFADHAAYAIGAAAGPRYKESNVGAGTAMRQPETVAFVGRRYGEEGGRAGRASTPTLVGPRVVEQV